MTPEEKARQKIDQWFSDAGWERSYGAASESG